MKGNFTPFFYRLFLVIIALCAKSNIAFSQDPSFSQFFANRLYLNPATTGSEQGMNVSAIYRYQWATIPGGFNTYGFSMDVQSPRLSSGLGMQVWQDREAKIFTTTSIGASYAYIVKISKMVNLSLGMDANFVNKHVDASKLIFTDQIDPEDGVVNPSSAVVNLQKVNYADIDAGMLLRFGWKYKKNFYHNSVGFSIHHLTTPVESFENIESKLPMRFTVHYGSMFPMGTSQKSKSQFYFSPVFKFDYQAGLKEFNYGFYNTWDPLFVGVFYKTNNFFNNRSTKTLIFTGGYSGNLSESVNIIVGYSYDLNLTGVTAQSKGVHEISIRARFPEISLLAKPLRHQGFKPQKCYDFGGKSAVKLF